MNLTPSYMKLSDTGELQSRAERMAHMLKKCALCPRACAVDRTSDELGECKAGAGIMVSNAFLHFGEEPPLVGMGGSGTIFLTHCNLRCVFCQNFHISHIGHGEEVGADELARMTLQLQAMGAQNINFVTPTHYAPQIVEAVAIAAERGLQLPIVWNCGGYESLPVIRALEGIVDIYMPDIKFFDNDSSTRYMDAPNYPKVARKVLKEMHRQVGPLELDQRGIARRGVLIRHLVMPDHKEDTAAILKFIAGELSPDSYVNIMEQYNPAWRSHEFEEINRRITHAEWEEARNMARELGLSRGF